MGRLEEKLIVRWSGLHIIVASLAVGGLGILPLLLYIVFGPADGNPIGLGLLAVATVPIAGIGILVGLIKLAVEAFRRQGR